MANPFEIFGWRAISRISPLGLRWYEKYRPLTLGAEGPFGTHRPLGFGGDIFHITSSSPARGDILYILATYISTIWKRVKSTSTPFKSTYRPLFVNHGVEKKTKCFAWNFTQKLIKTWKYGQLRRLAFLEHKSTQIIVF